MTIQTHLCECGREFMVNESYDPAGRCAVCIAYGGSGSETTRGDAIDEAKMQELADIKVALRELVDVLDKWRP